jgi:hypothetical protein
MNRRCVVALVFLTRAELVALLDAVNPALSPELSRAWEKLLDSEHAEADAVAIAIAAEKPAAR